MKFTVNGTEHEFEGADDTWLLDFLRRDLGITSAKDGCGPQAACGSCAVSLNGKVVMACATPMKKVADGEVRTLEGLDDGVRERFADAFATCGGAQCGFCIPGIVMRAACLLEKNARPTAEEIEHEGEGRMRAFITIAGNPVLSTPNGGRLDRALPRLDFMLSLDIYLNETTRHAHLILPAATQLESENFDVLSSTTSVRNFARCGERVFDPEPGLLTHDQVCLELAARLQSPASPPTPPGFAVVVEAEPLEQLELQGSTESLGTEAATRL